MMSSTPHWVFHTVKGNTYHYLVNKIKSWLVNHQQVWSPLYKNKYSSKKKEKKAKSYIQYTAGMSSWRQNKQRLPEKHWRGLKRCVKLQLNTPQDLWSKVLWTNETKVATVHNTMFGENQSIPYLLFYLHALCYMVQGTGNHAYKHSIIRLV